MIIKDDDYEIVPSLDDNFGDCWDLYLKLPKTSKDGHTRLEMKVVGYGMQLTTCLKRISNYRIGKKMETANLGEYLNAYKREVDRIYKLVNYEKKKK